MAAPNQVSTRALNSGKGFNNPYRLDYTAQHAPTTTTELFGGSCVHLNSLGQFEPGAVGTQMPMILIQRSLDYDVINESPPVDGWYDVVLSGRGSALVCSGGFQLETTEFDAQPSTTFAYNDALHSPTAGQITGGDKSAAGKLFNKRSWPGGSGAAIAPYTDNICGIAAGPVKVNAHAVKVLSFWTVYIPTSTGT